MGAECVKGVRSVDGPSAAECAIDDLKGQNRRVPAPREMRDRSQTRLRFGSRCDRLTVVNRHIGICLAESLVTRETPKVERALNHRRRADQHTP